MNNEHPKIDQPTNGTNKQTNNQTATDHIQWPYRIQKTESVAHKNGMDYYIRAHIDRSMYIRLAMMMAMMMIVIIILIIIIINEYLRQFDLMN